MEVAAVGYNGISVRINHPADRKSKKIKPTNATLDRQVLFFGGEGAGGALNALPLYASLLAGSP